MVYGLPPRWKNEVEDVTDFSLKLHGSLSSNPKSQNVAISGIRVIKTSQFWSRKGTGSDTTSARHRETESGAIQSSYRPRSAWGHKTGRDKKDLATEASQGLLSCSHFVIRLLASRPEQLNECLFT